MADLHVLDFYCLCVIGCGDRTFFSCLCIELGLQLADCDQDARGERLQWFRLGRDWMIRELFGHFEHLWREHGHYIGSLGHGLSDLIAGFWQVCLTEHTLSSLIAQAASRLNHLGTSGRKGSNDLCRFIDFNMLWVDLL